MHPRNFIRVVFGKRYPSDSLRRDVYSRAKAALSDWTRSGILRRDEEPGVYPYEQNYKIKGKAYRRLGVIALVRLDSRIYPHENIFGGPKLDRLKLMKAVNASLDPIFGLVPDEGGRYRRSVEAACRGRNPVAAFEFQGVRHRLWRITDPVWIRRIREALRSKDLVIADGHHRFEAARAYQEERRSRDPSRGPDAPYNFAMFYLSAAGSEEPGLLPTHRLVNVRPPDRLKRMLNQAKEKKLAEPVAGRERLTARLRLLRRQNRLGIGFYNGNGASLLLRPPKGSSFRLDVEWLQEEILRKRLGGDSGVTVSYTQDLEAAYGKVRKGEAQALFVMQPPRLRDVLERARAGRRMPRKTTYFYPKLVSGLVGYPFGE